MEVQRANRQNRRLVIFLAVLIVVIICLAVSIFVVSKNKLGSDLQTEETAEGEQLEELVSKKEEIIKSIEEELSRTETDEERAVLYSREAGELFNLSGGSDFAKEEILASAYEAERLHPTAQTAYRLAVFESTFGNKAKADEYLSIAESRGIKDIPGGG